MSYKVPTPTTKNGEQSRGAESCSITTTAVHRQSRRATIVGPPSTSASTASSITTSLLQLKSNLKPTKRILRKNTTTTTAMLGLSMDEGAGPVEQQTRTRSGSSGRVHFPDSQVTPEHAGEIVVQLSPDQTHADAHLGFLQEGRRYVVNLSVPRYLGDNASVAKANAHIQLKEIRTNADKTGHEFVLELAAYHESLVNEEVALTTGATGEFVLSLSARVLGKGKGTPMLKRGIRCVGVECADSEMSDASTTTHHQHHRHGDHRTTAASSEKHSPGPGSGTAGASASGAGAGAVASSTRRASSGAAAGVLLKKNR